MGSSLDVLSRRHREVLDAFVALLEPLPVVQGVYILAFPPSSEPDAMVRVIILVRERSSAVLAEITALAQQVEKEFDAEVQPDIFATAAFVGLLEAGAPDLAGFASNAVTLIPLRVE